VISVDAARSIPLLPPPATVSQSPATVIVVPDAMTVSALGRDRATKTAQPAGSYGAHVDTVITGRAHGLRTFKATQIAPYHSRGALPEPKPCVPTSRETPSPSILVQRRARIRSPKCRCRSPRNAGPHPGAHLPVR
jgi:hypothetical protein